MFKRKPLERSEKVRRKLDEESKTWINKASYQIANPNSSTRDLDGLFGSSDSTSAQPAKKVNRFFKVGWRLLSFMLVGAISFALFTAWSSPEYKVNMIEIKGPNRISANDITDVLDIYGRHIFSLERSQIMQTLQHNFPELRDIQVRFTLPGRVVITAFERTPAIIWQMKDAMFWIDSEGYLIPSRGDTPQLLTIRANNLPAYSLVIDEIKDTEDKFENVIRDKPAQKGEMDTLVFFANPKRINGHLLSAILQINAWMPDEPELLYQADRGVGWRDIRGWDVFVGSKLENINDKMLMYETIVRHLDEQGIQPKMVSVEFLHAPYFRLEE